MGTHRLPPYRGKDTWQPEEAAPDLRPGAPGRPRVWHGGSWTQASLAAKRNSLLPAPPPKPAARGQVSCLLPAGLADQKGLNPTLHLGPAHACARAHTHAEMHTSQPAATAMRHTGSLPSTQGVVCGWQRQKLTRPPRALPACVSGLMVKTSSLKKCSLGTTRRPLEPAFLPSSSLPGS